MERYSDIAAIWDPAATRNAKDPFEGVFGVGNNRNEISGNGIAAEEGAHFNEPYCIAYCIPSI